MAVLLTVQIETAKTSYISEQRYYLANRVVFMGLIWQGMATGFGNDEFLRVPVIYTRIDQKNVHASWPLAFTVPSVKSLHTLDGSSVGHSLF